MYRRFSITEQEARTVKTALRYLILKTELSKESSIETVNLIENAQNLYIKLDNYNWVKE